VWDFGAIKNCNAILCGILELPKTAMPSCVGFWSYQKLQCHLVWDFGAIKNNNAVLCGILKLPNAKLELPNAKLELPNAKLELPNTKLELPNTKLELPNAKLDQMQNCPLPRQLETVEFPVYSVAARQLKLGRRMGE
jgi:hypothetical protein